MTINIHIYLFIDFFSGGYIPQTYRSSLSKPDAAKTKETENEFYETTDSWARETFS